MTMARYVILAEDRTFFRFDESTGIIQALVEAVAKSGAESSKGPGSFEASIDTASDASAVRQYFTSNHHADPAAQAEEEPQWRAQVQPGPNRVKLSIKKIIVEGLETKPVTLELFPVRSGQQFSIFEWSAELAGRAERLNQSFDKLTAQLAQRTKELEEMVESNEAQRATYVAKVCAILQDRKLTNSAQEPLIVKHEIDTLSDATADTS